MQYKYVFILLLVNTVYSQKNYFEFKSLKKSEIPKIESKFGSKEYQHKLPYTYSGSESDLDQPISYVRNAIGNFPSTIVSYFYSPKKDLVKSIDFDWKLDINEDDPQTQKVENYNKAFDKLITSISEILGVPKPGQGNLVIKESPVVHDNSIHYERKVSWKAGSRTITALIVWSENHGQQMLTTIK